MNDELITSKMKDFVEMRYDVYIAEVESKCLSCRWFDFDEFPWQGTCRRHAPSPLVSNDIEAEEVFPNSAWPTVSSIEDWCGDHEKRSDFSAGEELLKVLMGMEETQSTPTTPVDK